MLISEQQDSLLFYVHLRKKSSYSKKKNKHLFNVHTSHQSNVPLPAWVSSNMYSSKFLQDKKKYEKSDTFWVLESGVTRCSEICSAIEITSGKTASLPSFSWELFKSFKKITFIECEWLPLGFIFLFIGRSLT